MKAYGCSTASEFLGDRIVYRGLSPADPRLPRREALFEQAGLPGAPLPRKQDPDYARVVVHLLRQARALENHQARLQRLVFVGDTRLSDATAFENLCTAGGWQGCAFIGSENERPPAIEVVPDEGGQILYLANRWAALESFDLFLKERGFPVDESTVAVLDLDKTILGARGRNSGAIDAARVEAIQFTVASLLGAGFDLPAFQTAYTRLNAPEFHPFTADNQDYLAYICLVLGSGLFSLDELVNTVKLGRLDSFQAFLGQAEARRHDLPPRLEEIHSEILARVQAGDPTPFKAFRFNEYRTTVARMGCLPAGAPVEQLLTEEIVLTQEVRRIAQAWQSRGALLFGLSDKPDEASFPPPDLAALGYQPLHRTTTHVAGE